VIRRLGIALAVVLALAAAVVALPGGAVAPPDARELRAHVEALTAPEMEGRGSGTPGGDRAGRYIAGRLAAAGLRPGGEGGTHFQPFVVASGARPGSGTALETLGPPKTLELGRHWSPHGGSLSGEVTGEVVFVGYGVVAPDGSYDDYAGVDVRGAIAVALEGVPGHRGDLRSSRLDKLLTARRRGAGALLIVGDALPSLGATAASVALVSGALSPSGADHLLAAPGTTLARLAAALQSTRAPGAFAAGLQARIRVVFEREDRRAANVIGFLPGADPALASEAVVVGAHYDHLGRVGGAVYPGADDNASGTAVVLALARAFASAGGSPRTLIFALFSGEEIGLLGSRHYVRSPTVAVDRTVAMVNLDMVGRLSDGRLTVGGVDSGGGLREILSEAGHGEGLDLVLNGSPFSPSDHSAFYAAGVPVLFFHTGRHADYHRPTDTADRIDADGMARIAAVTARVVERLAGSPRPVYAQLTPPVAGRGPRGSSGEAFLGVSPDLRSESDGLRLGAIVPGSAAARAGIRDGDVIVRLGEMPVNSFDDLRGALQARRPGDGVRIVYLREGYEHITSTTLDARP
jgi:hypothetical protein